MAQIRILRADINLRTPALDEALGNVNEANDFDPLKVARESFVRLGEMKPEVKQESALRAKLRGLRESIG